MSTPEAERDAAMAAVATAADIEFMRRMKLVAHDVPCAEPFLSTNDLWDESAKDPNFPTTHDNRAMGPIMAYARKKGWIEHTHRTVKDRRSHCHAQPIACWRSLLYPIFHGPAAITLQEYLDAHNR